MMYWRIHIVRVQNLEITFDAEVHFFPQKLAGRDRVTRTRGSTTGIPTASVLIKAQTLLHTSPCGALVQCSRPVRILGRERRRFRHAAFPRIDIIIRLRQDEKSVGNIS